MEVEPAVGPANQSAPSVVPVRLVTQLDAPWKVTEAPIELPTRLSRMGLSEVVNHLLGVSPPRPFDFLLGGELLRGSLSRGLAKHGLSGEGTVTLEYIALLAPPQPRHAETHPDWVSCLAPPLPLLAVAPPLLSGCYDGMAYLWSRDASVRADGPLGALRGHRHGAPDMASRARRREVAARRAVARPPSRSDRRRAAQRSLPSRPRPSGSGGTRGPRAQRAARPARG